MKKTGLWYRIVCIILTLLLCVVPVAANSADADLPISQGCRTINAQVPMYSPAPDLANLYAAFLFDTTNDILLYSVNPDQPYSPASLVKIMTGLIIAERADLDEQVTVRQDVLDTLPFGSLNVGLQDGEVITMRDLLYCIMVPSANDASAVAADHVCGSQEAFVKEMNTYAAKLGCTNTNFTSVHGLHDDQQRSTARDIAIILIAAAENPVFMEFFGAASYTVPATNLSEPREIISANYLITQYDYMDSRVTGGRVGTIDTGERNLAVTAQKDDISLISVVLGAPSTIPQPNSYAIYGSFKETSALLDIGFAERETVQIFYENQVLKQFPVKNGDSDVTVCVKESVFTSLPQGVSQKDLTYRYSGEGPQIQAPIEAGDIISEIQIWYDTLCLARADLYALHGVKEKGIISTEEITQADDTGSNTLLIAVGIIVGLLVVLIFGRRMIMRVVRRRRIRRNRKNRRRSR